jgi:hypothetical protein
MDHLRPVLASPSTPKNEPEESLELLVFGHSSERSIVGTYELNSDEILK